MSKPSGQRIIRRGPYPELTWQAIIVGYMIGSVITISVGYASLILGFSFEGSELAAILGWGVLRGIMKRSSIVENNINQTIASAVNGASAGMMFSIPALFILEPVYKGVTTFSIPLMVLACVVGGILGLCFVIPLRKQMIDFSRLAYPGGIAVATILKSPGAGMRKAMLLLGAALVSGIAHLLAIKVFHTESLTLGMSLGLPQFLNLTFYLSLMTIGVGFLSGKGGLVFGFGGFLCYWVLAPMIYKFGGDGTQVLAVDRAAANFHPGILEAFKSAPTADLDLRGILFKPVGIGMLIGAAIGGIVAAAPLIKSAIQSMQDAAKAAKEGKSGVLADEMPISLLYGGIAVGAVALVAIAFLAAKDMTLGRAVGMAVLGTLWIWIAGVIVSECLGRTNWSPLSGMTLIAVTILIFIASGIDKVSVIVASVVVGAAICVAIAQAGDMMLDLKSGYLVGASPKKQQIGQFIATWLGPILIMGLIFVLHKSYGLGSAKLPAPQGKALASMIEGIVGGNVPVYRYIAGAGLGGILAFSGLGGIGVLIGLGFYMPFDIALTYTIGCGLRIWADKAKGTKWVENEGIPLAAGLIVGEALVGVGVAIIAVLKGV